ncbi:MAG: type III-B CRISPR module RAMP protein Cmr1 [Lentisphaerae bacterium]|nr:type III-B CRISPR module RAMP protein Cmr1 [Lentisphaerota bacterium]
MKTLFDGTMEIITPCFCAGANQAKAEIRAPSIRGELRWWFRALGGTREQEARKQEARVFGSIKSEKAHTENQASALVVRVSDVLAGKSESRDLPNNHKFFTMSRKGPETMIPAGRQFRLQIIDRKGIEPELLKLTIDSCCRLGAIGLRARRGCGALQSTDYRPTATEVSVWADELRKRKFEVICRAPQQSAYDALLALEDEIKGLREDERIEKNGRNAMGFVQGSKRHASCLRVRPVLLENGKFLPVMVYSEAALGQGIKGIRSELKAHFG